MEEYYKYSDQLLANQFQTISKFTSKLLANYPYEPLVAVFAPGAQRTRSLSLDTMATPEGCHGPGLSDHILKNWPWVLALSLAPCGD